MSRTLVVDLESLPCPDLPFAPPDDDPGRFPPVPHHQVAVIGCLLITDWLPSKLLCLDDTPSGGEEPEHALLRRFAAVMRKEPTRLVTWNGRGYDLPVIIARSLKHGVTQEVLMQEADPPRTYPSDTYLNRYSTKKHCDVKDVLQGNGACHGWHLDTASKLLGRRGKGATGFDGSQVERVWQEPGGPDRVRRYCLRDVLDTAWTFFMLERVRGVLSEVKCDNALGELVRMADRLDEAEEAIADGVPTGGRAVDEVSDPQLPDTRGG